MGCIAHHGPIVYLPFYYFQVLLIVPSHLPFPPSKTVKHSAYDWPLEKDYLENTVSKCFSGFKWKAIRMPKIWEDFLITTCRAIIKHVKKHQEEFKSFDLVFGDSPPDCHVIIAEFLVLPRIDIKPAYAMRHRQMELGLVSYIPSIKSSNIGEMSLMGRFQNLISFGSMKVWKIYHFTRLGELKAEFNITPERNFQESVHLAEMTLIMGHFALEYPQPLLPGIERNSLLHYDYEGIVNDAIWRINYYFIWKMWPNNAKDFWP